jgi:N-acetyl-alpha-D-muramate 1-phosphate uridylyltransferase
MSFFPTQAFVLAAGKGNRLKPYTDHMPKPLVAVAGKPLLEYILDDLQEAGVTHIILNAHHLKEKIIDFANIYHQKYPSLRLDLSVEDELLETGGSARKIMPLLKTEPFYMINGDAFFVHQGPSYLRRMAEFYDAKKMDILIMLQDISRMVLTEAVGDYDLLPSYNAKRNKSKSGSYMFAGARISSFDILHEKLDSYFSYLELMDFAEKKDRLFGLSHEGDWHHISTPKDLDAVNRAMKDKRIFKK